MPVKITSYDQYLFAVVVLVGTYLAAVLLLWLSQRSRFTPLVKSFHGIAQNFLTVINVLFALNLAFLANDTWSAHDRALNAVFQEAGDLRSILDLAHRLPDPSRSAIDEAVKAYAHLAIAIEWPMLARRTAVADQLDALLTLLSDNDVAAALNTSVQSLMLGKPFRSAAPGICASLSAKPTSII